ncbi:MAG: hypothetical protein ACFFBD_22405 [Candidatus Hodarchaeota archaeon]
MYLVLRGHTVTPIITKQTQFHLLGCRFRIKHPRRRHICKINTGKPMYPYSLIGFVGELEVWYQCSTEQQAEWKLTQLLEIDYIGRYASEGMGEIRWNEAELTEKHFERQRDRRLKLRIRKGLPHNLPPEVQQLLRYALLHDFVHTEKHNSKIYVELDLPDLEYLHQHHSETPDSFIRTFQKYDRLAAGLTRKIRAPRTSRYTWESQTTIDFDRLAQEISAVHTHIWKLYEYIYQSDELGQVNESLEYGHSSLRTHLSVIVNLIVRDYQKHHLNLADFKT